MATPGGAAPVGGSRAEEPPPAAPSSSSSSSSQAPAPGQAAEQAGQQQPSPAEQKFPPPPPPAQPPPPPSAQAQQQAGDPPNAAPPPPNQHDASFLPLVHDIIKCMDKDSQDVHQVLNDLRNKFVEMRKLVKSTPGIGVSPERQQEQLQSLREQVRTKSKLLQKYKTLCMFEIPKE